MPIDFPNSPTNGQEFTSGGTTWVYDGTKWNVTQTLLGQITLPDEVYGVGVMRYAAAASHPWEDGTWPFFADQNSAWWGAWNNYTKEPDGTACTVPVYP